MVVSWNRGTPSHPNFHGIFHSMAKLWKDSPVAMETPRWSSTTFGSPGWSSNVKIATAIIQKCVFFCCDSYHIVTIIHQPYFHMVTQPSVVFAIKWITIPSIAGDFHKWGYPQITNYSPLVAIINYRLAIYKSHILTIINHMFWGFFYINPPHLWPQPGAAEHPEAPGCPLHIINHSSFWGFYIHR